MSFRRHLRDSHADHTVFSAHLTPIRAALSIYNAEHNSGYPDSIVDQLTMYTDVNGTTSATKTATAIYGPYLLEFPRCPVGPNAHGPKAHQVLVSHTVPVTVNEASGEGWVHNPTTGEFRANINEENINEEKEERDLYGQY